MVVIVRFGPGWPGFGCISQFVLKIETYLRMANIEYEVKDVGLDFPDAPKGKLPYIEHEGRLIADSNIIIDYLKDHFGDPLDSPLLESQKATSHMIKRMMEEHIWWIMNRERWWAPEDPYWHTSGMLEGLAEQEFKGIRDDARRKCMEHGVGAFTDHELEVRGKKDLDAISLILGDQSFLHGQQPSSVDATVYAFLFQILNATYTSSLKSSAKSHENLSAYVGRIFDRWFSKDPLSADRKQEIKGLGRFEEGDHE